MRLAALLAFLFIPAPGCTGPDENAQALTPSCGQRFAGAPGHNAALISRLQDDAETVASRLASVAGDELAGSPEALPDGGVRFPTRTGHAIVTRTGDEAFFTVRAEWGGTASWAADSSHDAVLLMLTAFDVPPERVRFTDTSKGQFVQTHKDDIIGSAGGWAARAATGDGLAIGPLYDIKDAEAIDSAQALAIARAYAACAWAVNEGGLPAQSAGWGVRDASLTRAIIVTDPARSEEGHCGVALEVHVDAATGAVRTAAPPLCD